MDKLKMHTINKADENYQKLVEMFPTAITETIDENGNVVRAIDKDVLMQEINVKVVDGQDERYQFTWPDKKKSMLLANLPTNKTLRPCKEESVGKNGTKGEFDSENLYIEGDNLEVLKLLKDVYPNKIKMIYIDPPYNSNGDFIYKDNFYKTKEEFLIESNQYDKDGNKLVKSSNSNGRFHTDWLNMIYSRLKLSKDLLSNDGVIFISIDDNEQENLKKCCDEIFGATNYIATIIRNTNSSKNQSYFISVSHEYCLVYSKNKELLKTKHSTNKWSVPKNNVDEYIKKVEKLQKLGLSNDEITEELKILTNYPRFIDFTNYWYFDERGLYCKDNLGGVNNGNKTPILNPLTGNLDPVPPGGFRFGNEKLKFLSDNGYIHFHTDGSLPRIKRYLSENLTQRPKSIMSDDQRPDNSLMKEFNTPFDNPKQLSFIKRIVSIVDSNSIVLDFFSGSSTTAHAVMDLNARDGGKRKFIMVQLPEKIDEKHSAYKAGYRTICDIGKKRIKLAGEKIKEENNANIDYGFRVLKCDNSNMKDVYYNPSEYNSNLIDTLEDNIKKDRTSEDLLFQVMLDLGILLSSKIEETSISSKKVFKVEDNYLIACFDDNITEDVIIEIAKQKPYYFVLRDASLASDSVATNFEQIFTTYSPDTVRKVL